jgi:rubredoxin
MPIEAIDNRAAYCGLYCGACPVFLATSAEGGLKSEGWRAWLSKMEEKWRCPDCTNRATWWDRICPSCKASMPGFKKLEES